ncbi:MAG: ATP-binding cassette domain-containing protein [Eubacteriales bacterium]
MHKCNWELQEPFLSVFSVDINLTVKAGETVAIVGENGSGKTTLVRVMTGMLSPKSGQVLYDDVDISKTRCNKVYDIISVAFQDFMKYKMTIRDNICIGNMAKKEIQKGVKETEIKQKK